jgi:hypothetical protein
MSTPPGTIQLLLDAMRTALGALGNRLRAEEAPDFFADLGVTLTPGQAASLAAPLNTFRGSVIDFVHQVGTLDQAALNGDAQGITHAEVAGLARLAQVLSGLPAVASAVGGLPGVPPDVVAALPGRIVSHMLTEYMGRSLGLNELLEFTGILQRDDVNVEPGGPGDPGGPFHTIDTFHLDQIGLWLSRPGNQLAQRYDWGAPGFDGTKLLQGLSTLIGMLGLPALLDSSGPTPALDLVNLRIVPRTDLTPPGLALHFDANTAPAAVEHTGPDWKFTVGVDFGLGQGTEIVLQPNGTVTISPPDATSVAGAVRISYEISRPPETPMVILGSPGASRLEAGGLVFYIEIGLRWDGAHNQAQGTVAVGGAVQRGKVVLDLSSADGFLATILPAAKIENDFEVEFGYSTSEGLHFHGSGALEIKLPVHIKLGAVEVTALALSLQVQGAKFPTFVSGDVKAALGPITAVVEDVGVGAALAFADGNHGNLGPVDVGFAFKPPKGAGLAIDAGVVTGGGYLRFDPDRGEYAGALELEFAGFIAVKAIGLITTRMPDGSRGFSLLIVMTAEFGEGGIQLGFGFTLLGVGGILGLNRRMALDALVEGVVSGSIQSVLFPQDVIANAPRIVSDLRKFFPPEDGRFLIGPMAKIGWGTPTLVSVSLGVIVEIPPGDIAILGLLSCILPSTDVPLLVLQVQFVGAFEPDKSRLWFFAQLFESRVLTMTIDGGMGLLIYMGDNPEFVLSVGGFHPSFKPPPLPFPPPPRVSVDILNGPGRLLRVSGYFAVTSNTVQFGAKAELRLGFSDFGIEGHLSFDALFQFSPFRFIIDISAGLSLKAFGVGLFSIDLQFTLEGPAPWRAHGRGSISLLFFEISADFDLSWGEERTTTLPPVEVLALLEREVRKVEGWRTRLPEGGGNPLVTLRQLPEGELVLHPLGTLFIHQRAIPLDVRIDRVGAQRPSDGKRFSVEPVQGSGLERVSITGDQFAMAQFQDMDDATKLSRPAYENQDAGLELTAEQGAIASPRVVRRSARYELHIIDNHPPNPPHAAVAATAANGAGAARRAMSLARPLAVSRVRSLANGTGPRSRGKLYSPHPAVFGQLLEGSSTARSALSRREARLRQPFPQDATVQVTGDRFIAAYQRNNRQAFPPAAAGSTTSSFRSEATAADAIADWVRADAGLSGQLHVLRQAEAGGGEPAERGTWSVVAPPPSVVSAADAVRLTGGQVLVAGGADAAGKAVAAAAVYDPVTGAWAAKPPLATPRRRHTTTRLRDGRAVAVGGLGAAGAPLVSAEVYDPVAGTWTTPKDGLHTARSGHSATPAGGGLLVAGGTSARGAALASAELLDPDTLKWAEIAPLNCARTGHQAVPIKDGKVLVVGGAVPTGERERALALAFCEIYDPAGNTWTPTGSLLTPRQGHQATVLADGKVLVTGGDAVPAVPYRPDSLATAELYDPDHGTWTRVADLPGGGRSGHRSIRTPAGVLVLGGVGRPRATAGNRKAVIFDPVSGAWRATDALGTGRWDVPAVDLADGRVLVVGGLALAGPGAPGPDPAELAATAEVYLP